MNYVHPEIILLHHHAPSQYIAKIDGSKNVHTTGAHLLKSCTRPWKCARQVQGAPLISDTEVSLENIIANKGIFSGSFY